MPAFQKLAAEKQSRVVFLGITEPQKEDPDWALTRAAIKELGLTFPTLIDTKSGVTRACGITGLPHTIIIDRAGIVRANLEGARGEDELRQELAKAGA